MHQYSLHPGIFYSYSNKSRQVRTIKNVLRTDRSDRALSSVIM